MARPAHVWEVVLVTVLTVVAVEIVVVARVVIVEVTVAEAAVASIAAVLEQVEEEIVVARPLVVVVETIVTANSHVATEAQQAPQYAQGPYEGRSPTRSPCRTGILRPQGHGKRMAHRSSDRSRSRSPYPLHEA